MSSILEQRIFPGWDVEGLRRWLSVTHPGDVRRLLGS